MRFSQNITTAVNSPPSPSSFILFCVIWFFTSHQQYFSYKGTGIPGLNQYWAGLMCLAQEHNALTLVRLEPAAPRSRVKHSTTEPQRSQFNTAVSHHSPGLSMTYGKTAGGTIFKRAVRISGFVATVEILIKIFLWLYDEWPKSQLWISSFVYEPRDLAVPFIELYGVLIFEREERIKSDPNGRLHLMSKGETKTKSEKKNAAQAFCNDFSSSCSPSNKINSWPDAETIYQWRQIAESTHEQLVLSLIRACVVRLTGLVLRRWFCCCWLFVYCYSHCGSL